ncbi:MAG: DUF1822 family protein [Pleurocapsa sp.]
MNFETALNYVNKISIEKTGQKLKKPEIAILNGCWQGMTYEQISNSSAYSTNYLMRDIAPKLWKTLSKILEDNIGKTNFRLKLCSLYESTVGKTENLTEENISEASSKNWQNASSSPSFFYGREVELRTFQQWLLEDRCHLLNIWGLNGLGKTSLMKRLGEQIQDRYDVVIWRNFAAPPNLSELVEDLLSSVFVIPKQNEEQLLPQLIGVMRSHRYLILLDGIEAIMQPHSLAGKYLPGYENYDLFFKAIERDSHQSSLVTTSLENAYSSTNNNNSVRHWKLTGLSTAEAKALIKAEQINNEEAETKVISYYLENPEKMINIEQIVRQLFNNNIQEFLTQKLRIFGEIHRLLNDSFDRLSVLEKEILYWLAAESQPMCLPEIQNNLPLSIYPVELIEALKSLVQRSLLTTEQIEGRSVFVLSEMTREFVFHQFVAQIGNKFYLDTRLNSSLAKDSAIELGNISTKPTYLSQWLSNNFAADWQPIEILFVASGKSPARLRSAFSLRGAEIVKRFKQIELDRQNSLSVLLLVAISQDGSAFKICVQAQPNFDRQILPHNLELNLLDASETVLASIQADARDNYIQLPYFRGVLQEEFGLSLSLDSITYQEKFVI